MTHDLQLSAAYAENHTSPEDALLAELVRYTHLHAMHPRMLSGHLQGKLLEQISCMIRPLRALEVGTFTGYATLCLAKGLPGNGVLHTIERNDELSGIAAAFIARSPHASKIKMHTGDALQIIPTLDETFDLAYIDGDKREYCAYYHALIGKVRSGGFLLADNVWWNGKVTETPAPADRHTQEIHAFNELVQTDRRVENLFLPLRDGLMIIRKR
ncbi:MAG: O-methyltransferase [Prevotellaceae bacterium]|jgi:predicted O-methyltransferase YrrM|nr:O-methyltransferase [Prevotellaceae bacterium]